MFYVHLPMLVPRHYSPGVWDCCAPLFSSFGNPSLNIVASHRTFILHVSTTLQLPSLPFLKNKTKQISVNSRWNGPSEATLASKGTAYLNIPYTKKTPSYLQAPAFTLQSFITELIISLCRTPHCLPSSHWGLLQLESLQLSHDNISLCERIEFFFFQSSTCGKPTVPLSLGIFSDFWDTYYHQSSMYSACNFYHPNYEFCNWLEVLYAE